MYYTDFTVRGKGSFPTDMLRYDRCSPKGPRDVDGISLNRWNSDREEMDIERNVTLRTFHRYKADKGAVTEERWLSMSWPVIEISKPQEAGG